LSSRYYQAELANLRTLAGEFARAHPALAPMLAEPSADPDVERLLEGVAFLTGMVREKLDDDFPELIQGLTDLIFPHYLRPVPSLSIVAFEPGRGLRETLKVPAGTSLGARPVDGVSCLFSTCYPVEVHPLRVTAVTHEGLASAPGCIRVHLELRDLPLSRWQPGELVFYLGDGFTEAADLFLLLTRHLRSLTARPDQGGQPFRWGPEPLRPLGFEPGRALLGYPSQSFRGFRMIQEYFALPQKYLFLGLSGWAGWRDRGDGAGFTLEFELEPGPVPVPRPRPEQFTLFATPVVNLFPLDAEPVLLDHRHDRVPVRPARGGPHEVYSVEAVTGLAQGTLARREYVPLGRLGQGEGDRPVYQVTRSRSPLDGRTLTSLYLGYPPAGPGPAQETLAIRLTCTNGSLPERLQLGDICQPTGDSPERAGFRNLLPATSPLEPPFGRNSLWRLLSHLSLNLLSLASAGALQELLLLYLFEGRDRVGAAAHRNRIAGIESFRAEPRDRLFRGQPVRGHDLLLRLGGEHFGSQGDQFLFASVLEALLGLYASLNAFVRLTVEDAQKGGIRQWPARTGDRPLI